MDLRDTIINLDDGSKYIVNDYVLYAGKTYLLMLKTTEDETDVVDGPVIAELVNNNVTILTDKELSDKLLEIFKLNITE